MRVPLTARRVLALTCAGVLGLMGGCVNSPSTSTEDTTPEASATTPTEPTGPNVKPACSLAPASLIKETLNLTVNAPTETASGSSVQCTYLSGIGGYTVEIRFETEQDAASFADRRRATDDGGEPTTDVSGVGDEAYQSSIEFGDTVTNTMVARKGSVEIQVAAAAPVDAEKALLTKLFAALT